MKYLWKLFLSLKEIFIMFILQYCILFICFAIFGPDKSIIWTGIFLIIINIIYILWKSKRIKFSFKGKNYLSHILIGIGISSIYNMIIFRLGLGNNVTTDYNIILNIISSGIVGPIFEEFLFRYDLIRRLEKFNSNKYLIIILSSVIFALFHTGITTIIYAFIVGIINSYIYMKYKDIIKPIIIHISGNIFVTLLSGYNIWILIFGIFITFIGGLIIRNND